MNVWHKNNQLIETLKAGDKLLAKFSKAEAVMEAEEISIYIKNHNIALRKVYHFLHGRNKQ